MFSELIKQNTALQKDVNEYRSDKDKEAHERKKIMK